MDIQEYNIKYDENERIGFKNTQIEVYCNNEKVYNGSLEGYFNKREFDEATIEFLKPLVKGIVDVQYNQLEDKWHIKVIK